MNSAAGTSPAGCTNLVRLSSTFPCRNLATALISTPPPVPRLYGPAFRKATGARRLGVSSALRGAAVPPAGRRAGVAETRAELPPAHGRTRPAPARLAHRARSGLAAQGSGWDASATSHIPLRGRPRP